MFAVVFPLYPKNGKEIDENLSFQSGGAGVGSLTYIFKVS